ncbi:8455_t:CDS:2 [Diversispora eburnea]|uniref:NudC domain-containing protein 1 n=1 Tax=Diversispora eburnea TaxID=1213867 RepID=A0A9N8ZWJ3_9GLOM|nr:8455_t:CDS:2 [Diversispora eburnea]
MSQNSEIPYTIPLKPNRSLLNPKFEGYKLKLFDENNRLQRFPLPSPGISLPKIPPNSKLSYKEIQNDNLDSIVYSEYPSLKALSPTLLLATNGYGTIFLVQIEKNEFNSYYGKIIYRTEFNVHVDDESKEIRVPCVILDAKIIGERDNAHVLFLVYNTSQYSKIPIATQNSSKNDLKNKTLFDVSLIRIPLKPPYDIQVIHVIRGTEIPKYCSIEQSGDGYVIGSNDLYGYKNVEEISTKDDEIKDDEIKDDEIKNDNNTNIVKSQKVEKFDKDQVKEPPYIWTQTSTDVTVCFNLSPGTPKSAVHCNFSKTHLSLTIQHHDNKSHHDKSLPCYVFTKLFDLIDPDASLWTIESKIGLLTLHLEKHHNNTRWSHIFQNDDGVFETIDPNEFAEFRERLEKYTTELLNSPNQQLDKFKSPISHEMEESIDYEGNMATFYWINLEGKTRASAGVESNDSSPPLTMTHIATFNALAFVQASKREKRFMYHDPSNRFVIILEGNHHAFVYWDHDNHKEHGEQSVVDFVESKFNRPDLIGIQMVDFKNAVILVLTTDSLIIVNLI